MSRQLERMVFQQHGASGVFYSSTLCTTLPCRCAAVLAPALLWLGWLIYGVRHGSAASAAQHLDPARLLSISITLAVGIAVCQARLLSVSINAEGRQIFS